MTDATTTLTAETRVLFLARRHICQPEVMTVLHIGLAHLCQSTNAAIATEAGRLFARLEQRRMGDGGDGA